MSDEEFILRDLKWLNDKELLVQFCNCKLKIVMDEKDAKDYERLGINPQATLENDVVNDYEIKLILEEKKCPLDCEKIVEELSQQPLVFRVELLEDGER